MEEADELTTHPTLSIYDGGVWSEGQSSNAISFASSISGLNMTITDQDEYSYASAVSSFDNSFYDNAQFTNFDNIIASDFNDVITLQSADDIAFIDAGAGFNTIFLSDVSNVSLNIHRNSANEVFIDDSNNLDIYDYGGSSDGQATHFYLGRNATDIDMLVNGVNVITEEAIRSSHNELSLLLSVDGLDQEFAYLDELGLHIFDGGNTQATEMANQKLTYRLDGGNLFDLYESAHNVHLSLDEIYADTNDCQISLSRIMSAMDYLHGEGFGIAAGDGRFFYSMMQLVQAASSMPIVAGGYTGAAFSQGNPVIAPTP